jgi:predicted regulator of Ras-like GTPase activity (Roadblock/LC7/MglB family)
MSDSNPSQFAWLIDEFVDRTPGVSHAAAVSSDGLLIVASAKLPRDRAEQLAAVTSGLAGLTEGAARCFDAGPVSETVVEMEAGTMIVMTIVDGSHLATLAESGSDLGLVGYEMALLVEKFGRTLTPERRDVSPSVVAG